MTLLSPSAQANYFAYRTIIELREMQVTAAQGRVKELERALKLAGSRIDELKAQVILAKMGLPIPK